MNAHILTYRYTEDYLNKRTPFRKAHIEYINAYIKRKEVLLGGATADPADKGIIIFDKLSIAEINNFVQNDPYYENGVVTDYYIQVWNVVVGSLIGGGRT